jgi:peptidoglycan/xylan/chitin deacetylase (PgdA/CDA1 family)
MVLTVHGVGRPRRTLDPGEDRIWVTIKQFEMVLDALASRQDVRITFDDGNDSDVEVALPRLLERGLTAEFFLLAGRIGQPGLVDRAGVTALRDAGMSIGSHGWAHRDWRVLDEHEAHREIVEAAEVISELSGRPVSRVAIPFGSYDRVVLGRLRRAGYERVYTSDGGRSRPGQWLQARTSLSTDLAPESVRHLVEGRQRPDRRLRGVATRTAKRLRGPLHAGASCAAGNG